MVVYGRSIDGTGHLGDALCRHARSAFADPGSIPSRYGRLVDPVCHYRFRHCALGHQQKDDVVEKAGAGGIVHGNWNRFHALYRDGCHADECCHSIRLVLVFRVHRRCDRRICRRSPVDVSPSACKQLQGDGTENGGRAGDGGSGGRHALHRDVRHHLYRSMCQRKRERGRPPRSGSPMPSVQ